MTEQVDPRSAIEIAFAKAREAGASKPSLRAEGLVFKSAPLTGQNPGAVYVTKDGEYLGKIVHGQFRTTKFLGPELCQQVGEISQHPAEHAIKHGQKTGECSICGRPLHNATSVRLGIGPICAEKFGFILAGWNAQAEDEDDGPVDTSML